jgi:dGTPase
MDETRKNMLRYETTYSKYATLDADAIRLKKMEEDIRPSYYHDIDRIIYSLSYARYMDKTQVFSNSDNDHICKRMIHVNLVSKIARTIGRALGLNEDLIEAIALGHDLGHVPFGHTGEAILNELSLKYDNTYFNHNVQSMRLLKDVENHGLGNNLTIQTLDGILCHNGEFCMDKYEPVNKTKEEFLNQYEDCYKNKDAIKKLRPMTLEGCVVRLSDIVAYVGRDIEDAIRLGVLEEKELPIEITSVLGKTNREIVNTIILDVIENSKDKSYIKLSDSVFKALVDLKKFNYEHIYSKANTKEQIDEYKKMFSKLFEIYLKQIEENKIDEDIYKLFLNDMVSEYLQNTNNSRKVIDYIAGMTDAYFIRQYEKYKNY